MQTPPKINSQSTHCKGDILLSSECLLLRNVVLDDLNSLVRLAGDYCIAEMMNGSIPYPYPPEKAREWIVKHLSDSSNSPAISWAIVLKEQQKFIGSIQIRLLDNRSARLSYWIGKLFWNQGYATEAGRSVLKYCFETLSLKEIQAEHFQRNPASGHVLKKLGFTFRKTEIKKEKLNNSDESFDEYAITESQFFTMQQNCK